MFQEWKEFQRAVLPYAEREEVPDHVKDFYIKKNITAECCDPLYLGEAPARANYLLTELYNAAGRSTPEYPDGFPYELAKAAVEIAGLYSIQYDVKDFIQRHKENRDLTFPRSEAEAREVTGIITEHFTQEIFDQTIDAFKKAAEKESFPSGVIEHTVGRFKEKFPFIPEAGSAAIEIINLIQSYDFGRPKFRPPELGK